MRDDTKKEVRKIFNVSAFLFVSIFFILPYLTQVSTYFHERGHMRALEKYGVESSYEPNLLSAIPNFFNPNVEKLGVTRFSLSEYSKLGPYQKAEVNLAGIVSDLTFLLLIGVYLSMANVYLAYKVIFKKPVNAGFFLAINWILFMWLLVLIQITLANVTYEAGDFYHLIDSFIKYGVSGLGKI